MCRVPIIPTLASQHKPRVPFALLACIHPLLVALHAYLVLQETTHRPAGRQFVNSARVVHILQTRGRPFVLNAPLVGSAPQSVPSLLITVRNVDRVSSTRNLDLFPVYFVFLAQQENTIQIRVQFLKVLVMTVMQGRIALRSGQLIPPVA